MTFVVIQPIDGYRGQAKHSPFLDKSRGQVEKGSKSNQRER